MPAFPAWPATDPVATGVTVPEPLSATYKVLPLGVTARAQGARPTRTGVPGFPVAALIGVTVSDPLSAT